jgi:septum formation protein
MLLEWAELEFDIIPSESDENWPSDMPIDEVPLYIARNKAQAVRQKDIFKRYENKVPVLAADTIVVLDADIIGKPEDREMAIQMLNRLSGKKHLVITGVIICDNDKEIAFTDTTEVEFYPLNGEDIVYYVDRYRPYDKAGAYAIQEWIGVVGIRSVKGDFYNVMGLPVSRVIAALRDHFS